MAKCVYTSLIPSGYKCVNVFGILFIKKGSTMSDVDLNHEYIHTAQIKELWYVPYYFVYAFLFCKEWFSLGCKQWHTAYKSNPMEQEAYQNEENLEYLDMREKFAWTSY